MTVSLSRSKIVVKLRSVKTFVSVAMFVAAVVATLVVAKAVAVIIMVLVVTVLVMDFVGVEQYFKRKHVNVFQNVY